MILAKQTGYFAVASHRVDVICTTQLGRNQFGPRAHVSRTNISTACRAG